MRVLHGVSGAAGQPWTISRAQRDLGIDADCLLVEESRLGYASDLTINPGEDKVASFADEIGRIANEYDIFHFYFRPLFYFDSKRLIFPTGLDLLTLRAAGKTIIYHFRGSEIRLHSEFKKRCPYHYVDENPNQLITNFPEATMRLLIRFVRAVAHRVLVPDPELATYVEQAIIVPRAIDMRLWPYVGPSNDENPLVIHAPTRRIVKGSDHVIRAVKELKAEGLRFRFEMIENLKNAQARERYRQADIVVDQLRIGWYGVLAVEAMALGKAVVSYVRDDLLHHMGAVPPIAVANPDTIKEVLRRLVLDKKQRAQLGCRARDYCEKEHAASRIARQLKDVYEQARSEPSELDVPAVMALFKHQERIIRKQMPSGPGAIAKNGVHRFVELSREHGLHFATQKAMQKLLRRFRLRRSGA